ncbi:alanyl-tRNA editing protein [Oceanithermus sp.]|uniref:alanyl-tRNA editing protein n=1 Tax=Oceanithermus sp. TaxID=2268145 RepID=UPI00257AB359|nr:alanyl-tRNA editing protein [Oceanithermus sp.]
MSERLFWQDPYATRFEATVTRAWEEGGRFLVELDRTLFYPTSGGQPHDTGTLGGVRVLDVFEPEKHGARIVHVLEAPLEEGARVEGEVDWSRRYRHMQRHTGQHILSQAFLRAAQWNTIAVSLAGPEIHIDFDVWPGPEAAGEVLEQAEALANWAVYANLAVSAREVPEAQVPLLPLRRMPKVRGAVRVVEIEDWDLAPCGGTHLRSTAEAGPIKLLGFEKGKKKTIRVYARSGWEALEDYAAKHRTLKTLAARFSSGVFDVPERVKKLEEELYAARGEAQALAAELAEGYARELARAGFPAARQVPLAALAETGRRVAEWPGALALLAALEPGGEHARLLLVAHQGREAELQELWKERLEPLGARGGGRGHIQGRLPAGKLQLALGAFPAAAKENT